MAPEEILAKIDKLQKEGKHMPCPRCGKWAMDEESVARNAMSRSAEVTICDRCGNLEGYEVMLNQKKPLADWYAVIHPESFFDGGTNG